MVDQAVLLSAQKLNAPGNKEALALWYKSTLETVRSDSPDLTARQLTVLLTIATEKGPHTVRALAAHLDVTKPAISRALDTLSRYEYAQRVVDKNDRRNIFVMPTEGGIEYLAKLSDTIMKNLLEMQ